MVSSFSDFFDLFSALSSTQGKDSGTWAYKVEISCIRKS